MEKNYSIAESASYLIDGDSSLAFLRLVREEKVADAEGDELVLEGYFNDLYKLFLRKLSDFDCVSHCDDRDKENLRAILDELIKVKGMLAEKGTEKNLEV